MTITFCSAAMAQRLARPANTLSLAALLTLAINPMYLFDIGCQLSFLAIAALVWLVSPACALMRQTSRYDPAPGDLGPRSALDDLERLLEPGWRKALRRAGAGMFDGVVASTVVWLAALPLVAFRFHLVSPIGIFLNIPLIPLTSAAMLLGGASLVLSAAWGPLGGPLAWATAWLLRLTQSIVLWGVAQPLGHRFVVGPTWRSGSWSSTCYWRWRRWPRRRPPIRQTPRWTGRFARRGAWWLLAVWIVPGWWLGGMAAGDATLEAEFLAVGHGLAVLIHTPDGQTLLYDCGRLGDPTVGRRIIAPALWARGVSRIDTVFLSHADQDHYDGLPDLLDRFPIRRSAAPTGFRRARKSPGNPAHRTTPGTTAYRSARSRRPGRGTRPAFSSRFRTRRIGWHPEASDNARSLVLDVAFHGRHLLLTGDLEQLGLDELVDRPPPEPPPDVFLAPHHGGRTANPEWLYEWAKPRLVVVSQRPVAAHASDALAPLERRGIPLLRTWRHGSIHFTWTDDGIDHACFPGQPR